MLIAQTPALLEWAPLIGVLLVVATGMATYLGTRHSNSGKIDTSQAGDLWRQTQTMIMTQNETIARLETQRDSLLDHFQHQSPIIEDFTKTLKGMQTTLDELMRLILNHNPASR